MLPVALGLAAGWLATLWLTRFMSSELYGLSRTDAAANIVGVTALCIIAALASYLPARRAARVDPVIALRCE
jgi:ABC-type lipoprotein release transport system permease subunit